MNQAAASARERVSRNNLKESAVAFAATYSNSAE
jgi:hypothetical protein